MRDRSRGSHGFQWDDLPVDVEQDVGKADDCFWVIWEVQKGSLEICSCFVF
jgi:hypothetical protein